jgi:tripartite-type tricarboxylate transporter receptor subunit TctC
MITALIAGDVHLAFLPQATGGAAVQGNTIRGLAVTGTKRQAALPHLPTVREEGIAGLEQGSWNAMWAPAGTPPDIVKAIQENMAKVLADPTVRERLTSVGQEPVGNSPAEFAAQFKADVERFAKVVETAKIPKLD